MKMADALVGAAVQVSLEKLVSFATDQIGIVKEFKKDLESLRDTVGMISAMVDDAEEKQVNHMAVKLWLKRLEALACRAEHVLDEVNYEMLRRRMEGEVSFFSSHKNIVFRLRMAHKLKNINVEFELINTKAIALGLQVRLGASLANTIVPPSSAGSSREKDSAVGQTVIGREKDASKIVHKLLTPSNEVLTSIPISGMGGLGKTTLAQFVYNNEQIIKQFGERIWVSVPEDCEPLKIFRLILESLTRDNVERLRGRDTIVQMIKGKLTDKRYLLVLDDVWSSSRGLWRDFLSSLRGICTIPGNWIIVTTRKREVASIFSAGIDFPLEKLSDENCLEIVKEKALIQEESIQYFDAIRENIVELCQGLPLVASVIGGLLCTHPMKEWISVLQKGISNMTGDEYSDVMQILKLSFDRLPSSYMKKCFTYCSLFEKDSRMEKKELIQLWMAEGYLQPMPSQDDMETGNECINTLLGSSLLQEVIDEEGECKCVRMHDLVHELARSISKPMEDLKDVKEDARYLVVDSSREEIKKLPKMRMLRTLFLRSGKPSSMSMISFKHLHVLRLTHVNELPSSIGNLMHLRYLGVFYSSVNAFPESVSKLYNLQTLRIKFCRYLSAFPKGMTKLNNLRHLHYNPDIRLPPNMGCLTSLQTLEYFVISPHNQIKELGYLKNLRGKLVIYNLDGVSSKDEAQQAGLNRKQINSLTFKWCRGNENGEKVLEGLQPHAYLQELEIESFSGNQFPSWFLNMTVCSNQSHGLSQRLDRLVSLSIKSCKRCKQLPALGKLPSLKYLKLFRLDDISCFGPSFYGITETRNNIGSGQVRRKIFPALKHLYLRSMKNLKEWMEYQTTNNEVVEMFPNLERLGIFDCPQLNYAPIHSFKSLKQLRISITNVKYILPTVEKDQICYRYPNSEGIFTSLEFLAIDYCSNLKSFPTPIGQQCLTFLRMLSISCCHRLTSLPHELFSSCPSLTHLLIEECDRLSSLPPHLLRSCTSLQYLNISNLRNLESFSFDLQETPSLMTAPELEPLCSYNSSSRLSKLKIGRFSDLAKVDWSELSWLSSLRKLELTSWHNLVSIPDQLQHLTGLTKLQLHEFGQIEALPDWFGSLASLEELLLFDCDKLCQLPSAAAMRSLTKLSELYIINCPLLKERCSQRSGPHSEWAKISHIPIFRCTES